jgi:hypothetical protein
MITIEHATLGLPLCIGCQSLRPSDAEVEQPWPCAGCGRMLRHRVHHRWPDTFCSTAHPPPPPEAPPARAAGNGLDRSAEAMP